MCNIRRAKNGYLKTSLDFSFSHERSHDLVNLKKKEKNQKIYFLEDPGFHLACDVIDVGNHLEENLHVVGDIPPTRILKHLKRESQYTSLEMCFKRIM